MSARKKFKKVQKPENNLDKILFSHDGQHYALFSKARNRDRNFRDIQTEILDKHMCGAISAPEQQTNYTVVDDTVCSNGYQLDIASNGTINRDFTQCVVNKTNELCDVSSIWVTVGVGLGIVAGAACTMLCIKSLVDRCRKKPEEKPLLNIQARKGYQGTELADGGERKISMRY